MICRGARWERFEIDVDVFEDGVVGHTKRPDGVGAERGEVR